MKMNRELLKKNFEARGYKVFFFDTKEDAAEFMKKELEGKTVGMGGCTTAVQMGINGYATTRDAAEVFLTSANGVAETGELVNIDGYGNRVAATLNNTEHLYWLIGKNKITPNLTEALYRAQNVAAPRNGFRLRKNTPCAKNNGEKCEGCRYTGNPECICHATVIHDGPMRGMDVKVLFIDEDLGL